MDLNNSTTPEAERDLAQTPQWFVDVVEQHFGFKFELDACCLAATSKCEAFYSLVDHGVDSLIMPWGRYNWCNPPYSNIKPWVDKATAEAKKGNVSCLLIPNKPEVKYIQQCRKVADTMIGMPFRLNFLKPDGSEFLDSEGKKQGPKFPVVLVLFTPWGLHMDVRDQYINFKTVRDLC